MIFAHIKGKPFVVVGEVPTQENMKYVYGMVKAVADVYEIDKSQSCLQVFFDDWLASLEMSFMRKWVNKYQKNFWIKQLELRCIDVVTSLTENERVIALSVFHDNGLTYDRD